MKRGYIVIPLLSGMFGCGSGSGGAAPDGGGDTFSCGDKCDAHWYDLADTGPGEPVESEEQGATEIVVEDEATPEDPATEATPDVPAIPPDDVQPPETSEEITSDTISDCDDGDPCTSDSFHPASGGCLHLPKDCDDEDLCSIDSCDKTTGSCIHASKPCDDLDACTFDWCEQGSGQCAHVGKSCDDGDACTTDGCDAGSGTCVHLPKQCGDNDPCTIDTCNGANGQCVHSPDPACGKPLPYITFDPAVPQAGQTVLVHAHDKVGWVYVGLAGLGPCGTVATGWKGVEQGQDKVYTWSYQAGPLTGGAHTFTFTADNGAKAIVTAPLVVSGAIQCGAKVCEAAGVTCQDDYPEVLTCQATGASKTVQCHKKGTCTEPGDGTKCSWGPGSYCDDPCESQPPPQGIVTASGGKFWLKGKEFRFVGMNARGLVHYGYGDVLPWAPADHADLVLDTLKAMGARVVRVFVANEQTTAQEAASRLVKLLDKAQARGVFVIAAMTDFYPTPFHPKGDGGFYATDPWGWTTLNEAFFSWGYQQNYMPLVQAVVAAGKGHPALFCWELGNEVKWAPNPPVFHEFAKTVSGAIAAIDPDHMITAGMISTQSCAMSWDQAVAFYGLPHIHFLTTHNYDGGGDSNLDVAGAVGKPLIIEEAGFAGNGRAGKFQADMAKWFGGGAKGYMQWGFMPSASDNGDGDVTYGMDHVWHDDWDALFALYKGQAAGL